MTESIENIAGDEPAAEAEAQPKVPDLQKQKAYVKNKRAANTKFVKRGTRRRVAAVESVVVTLIGELRAMVAMLQSKLDESEAVQGVLAKHAMGHELGPEETAVLDEVATRNAEPEKQPTPSPEPAPTSE